MLSLCLPASAILTKADLCQKYEIKQYTPPKIIVF